MNSTARRWMYAGIVVSSVAADQLVKHWARVDLAVRPGGTLPVIQDIFHFTYAENTGAAFSILQNQRWLFVILAGVLTLALSYALWFRKKEMETPWGVLLSLVLGGAIGNAIDRAARGFVVDMFEVRAINFAIFNVADICLVCGCIAMCAWVFYTDIRERRKKKDEAKEDEDAEKDHA